MLRIVCDQVRLITDDTLQPDQLILMFSMGRCGSTLASKILTLVPGVRSLSEPGPFLTLALDRFRSAPARQRALVTALTQLMFRPLAASDRVLALKFHSQVLFQADHFFAAFPRASCVFQYRDGLTWAWSDSLLIGFARSRENRNITNGLPVLDCVQSESD